MNAAAKAFSLPFLLKKGSGVNAFLRRIRAAVGAFTPSVLLGVWGKAPMHKQKNKAAHQIRKPSGEAKKLVKSLSQQPKQAKPHFGSQEQS